MNRINVVIVDDELKSVELLELKIQRLGVACHILAKFTDPDQALLFLKNNEVDLLFIDIEMPTMSGFELLEYLEPFHFAVVFVTAFDHYALRALRLSALDYLLKPVDIKELKEAFEKFQTLNVEVNQKKYRNLRENFRKDQQAKRISLVSKESIDFVPINSIVYCNSQSNYTSIKLDSGKSILMSKTLKEFEILLEGYDFIRVHHSYLVNKKHINSFIKKDGGYLVMTESSEVPVSRSRKEQVLQMIG